MINFMTLRDVTESTLTEKMSPPVIEVVHPVSVDDAFLVAVVIEGFAAAVIVSPTVGG